MVHRSRKETGRYDHPPGWDQAGDDRAFGTDHGTCNSVSLVSTMAQTIDHAVITAVPVSVSQQLGSAGRRLGVWALQGESRELIFWRHQNKHPPSRRDRTLAQLWFQDNAETILEHRDHVTRLLIADWTAFKRRPADAARVSVVSVSLLLSLFRRWIVSL